MKRRKIKYSSLLLIGIYIYIIVNIINVYISKNIETKIVSSENVEEFITKKGLLIRDEYLISSTMTGNIEGYLNEGDKVKKLDEVAYVYNDNIDKETTSELEYLEKEVIKIQEGQTSIIKADIDKLNNQIEISKNQIQCKVLQGDLNINKEVSILEEYIEDKNNLLKSDLNNKSIISKQEEITKLDNKIKKNSDILTTKKSGIISYKFDGNESKYNIDNISELTIEDIENTESEYKDILKDGYIELGDPVARVISDIKQYLAIIVEESEVKNFEKGNSIIIRNKNNKINAKVYDIFKEDDKNIVVFEISEQNLQINDTRVEEFDIIYKSIEGIKIPKECIVKNGNKEGVYIVSDTGRVKFVEIEGISYENDDFIVVNYYKNKVEGVQTIDIYDEIILEPNKVKNGSIVK